MFYVYLIRSKKDNTLYIGYTTDLKRRLEQHNNGLSRYTKGKTPWELVYFEGFKDRKLALQRENKLKYFGKAYGQLKSRIGL
jgi:putative endonuclease